MNRRHVIQAVVDAVTALAFLFILVLLAFVLTGCGAETRSDVQIQKRIVTVTKEIRQEISPSGEIVQLESVTRTTTSEDGQQIGQTETEIKPPQVMGMVATLAKVGATAVGGPAAGAAVSQGIDLISTLIGTSAAAVPAGMGYVALRKRKSEADALKDELDVLQRHRDQLIDSVEKARDELPSDADTAFVRVLGVKQDKDLQDYIKMRTA